MSHEAEIIVEAIVDDATDFFYMHTEMDTLNAFQKRLETRISAFESELIAQTRSVLIDAVKGAQV